MGVSTDASGVCECRRWFHTHLYFLHCVPPRQVYSHEKKSGATHLGAARAVERRLVGLPLTLPALMPESTSGPSPHTTVVVHPIVLLAAVDHYNRVAKNTKRRVVGMLLGETHKGVTDVTNSYAVPFEEDERDPNIWRAPPTSPPRQTTAALRPARAPARRFLDHSFHEAMFAMLKKVNAREKLVGWYSTGPKIRPGDLKIDQLVRRYCQVRDPSERERPPRHAPRQGYPRAHASPLLRAPHTLGPLLLEPPRLLPQLITALSSPALPLPTRAHCSPLPPAHCSLPLRLPPLPRQHPVLVIVDVKPKELGIPTEAYHGVEEILEGATRGWRTKGPRANHPLQPSAHPLA